MSAQRVGARPSHGGACRRRRSSRPSRKRDRSRCAEAPSMPEGPAERGVEATRAGGRGSARHAERIDGAERSGSIGPVMAERHPAAYCFAMRNHSCQGQIADRAFVHVDTAYRRSNESTLGQRGDLPEVGTTRRSTPAIPRSSLSRDVGASIDNGSSGRGHRRPRRLEPHQRKPGS
jgi:hypothetical protein